MSTVHHATASFASTLGRMLKNCHSFRWVIIGTLTELPGRQLSRHHFRHVVYVHA